MVIVEDFDDPAVLNRVAQKLQDAIAQPFEIEEHDIYVTSSIGISVYPDDSDDPRACSSTPTSRCTGRRSSGATPISSSTPISRERPAEAAHAGKRAAHRASRKRARAALPAGRTHRRHGRSSAPRRCCAGTTRSTATSRRRSSFRSPRSQGSIHALGDWVLQTAAEQCAAWRKAGLPLTVSVNLSGAAVLSRRPGAAHFGDRARRRLRAVVDRARGHRVEPAARPRRDPQGAAAAARRGLLGGDRRLRHRLLVRCRT